METARILLCLFCFAFAGWRGLPGSSTVNTNDYDHIVVIAQAQIGVKEATDNNDGLQVEAYLAAAGLSKGQPWCAAFLTWVFKQAGYDQPRTGWSPALFPVGRQVKIPSPGLVFSIYFPALNRIAHCGLIEQVKGNWISGIEGNTNVSGSRDGDGVYRKLRHVKTVHRYANWIRGNKKGGLP